jgi:hypothetical protein
MFSVIADLVFRAAMDGGTPVPTLHARFILYNVQGIRRFAAELF